MMPNEDTGRRAHRRIARRLLPYLFGLYVIAYLDRVNVGYAALQMTRDLSFGPEVYGFGSGIFFLGYFLLEIPGSVIVERWSARKWIARIMVTWGLFAICTGFIHTSSEFYWVRFLLGVSEAGFFPGVLVYLSHWFRESDRAKAMSFFIAAQPLSNLIGSPFSGWMLGIHWLGWPGWRWLFVLQGIPAVIIGFVTLYFLTDWPAQAKWLREDEREWITAELAREQRSVPREPLRFWHAFRRREVVVLCAAYFSITTSVYGFSFWFPTILKRVSAFSDLLVGLVAALPYCAGLAATLLIGFSSDRTGERRWHAAACMATVAFGLSCGAMASSVVVSVAMFCIAAMGMYGYPPAFWSIPARFLTGTAAAASIGLINATGNLGGFLGPYLVGYLTKATSSFTAGVLFLAMAAVVAAALILSLPLRTAVRALPMAADRPQETI